MKQIRFSHNYPKLWGQTKAELLAVRMIDAQAVAINKDLIEYDTKYIFNERYDHHGEVQDYDEAYYELPKEGKLIQLIFIGNKQIPFCTLRRYTKEKYEYYQHNIGEIFDVVVG
jgi:hypothetical protein